MTDTAAGPPVAGARQLARTGSRNFIGLVYFGAVNLVIVVIASRGLGANRAGELFTSIAVFNVIMRALVLGADIGLVRFISRSIALGRPDQVARLWRPALVPVALVGILAALIVGLAAEPLARAFGSSESEAAIAAQLRALAPILPFAIVYFCLESASRGFGTVRPSVAIEKVGKVSLQLLAITVAVAVDASSTLVALAWGAPMLVAFVAMALAVARLQRGLDSKVSDPPAFDDATDTIIAGGGSRVGGEFWRFCAPRAPAGVFQSALVWCASIFVGALASTREVAIYTAATRLLVVASLMQLAIGQTLQPLISGALARDDRTEANETFRSATAWAMLATWPLLIGLMVFGSTVLGIFGDEYVAAADALLVLSVAWMVAVACGSVDNVLLMAGKSWLTTVNTLIAFVVSVVLNLTLIPRFGMIGAAYAWGASLVLNNLVPLVQVRRFVGMSPFGPMMAEALRPLAAFAGALLASRLVGGTSVGAMAVGCVVGVGAYVVLARSRSAALRLDDLLHGLRRRARA